MLRISLNSFNLRSLHGLPKLLSDLLWLEAPSFTSSVELRNICQCHAEYTLAQFKVKALTYMGTPTRLAQDDDTFAAMLWNSIADSAIAVMALQASDYTINGAVSGLLLFKCLLLNSKVKASHNASLIIRKLGKALYIMREVGHDVTKFIFIYRGLLSDLNALGQSFEHGKTHIEEALLDHPDEQFVRYIQTQQDNDRENPPGNTMEQLMNKAQDKIDHIDLMKAQAAAEGAPT